MRFKIVSLLLSALFLASCGGVSVRPQDKEVVSDHDFEAEYYYMLGYEAVITGQWERAREYYTKALEHDPKSHFIRLQLAHLMYREGEVSAALVMVEDLLKESPDDVKALLLVSEIYGVSKRTSDSIKALKRALELAPEEQDARVVLGRLYYNNGMLKEAEETFLTVISADPEQYIALDYLASIAIDAKAYEKAEGYLKRLLEVKRLDPVYVRLGILYEIMERLGEAAESYETALKLNPQNSQARERAAQVYLKMKDPGRAIGEFLLLVQQQPENADMHVRLGLLYYGERDFQKALEQFRTALDLVPGNTTVRYYMGLVLEESENFDEAAQEFRKIITAEPKNVNAFLHLAIIYSKQKKEDEAIKIFEEVLEFDKEKPEIYIYLSTAYSRQRNYRRAEEILTDAVGRFQGNDELHFHLALVYDKTDRFDEMVKSLRKTIEINPRHAEALNYLGYYFADKDMNLEEARSLIERALEERPDSGYFLDSLAWVLFRQGRLEEAVEKLRKAMTIVTEDPVIYEHMGDIHNALQDGGKALEFWDKSLQFEQKEEGLRGRVEKKIHELKNRTR